MTLVELSSCEFGYSGRPVVRVEKLALRPGEIIGVFGPNGSGKTTLVRGLTGVLPPICGTVIRHGDVKISYLPQHQSMESHWPMSGFDAAAMIVSAERRFGWIGPVRRDVLEMMQSLNVADLADRPFFRLSGGQQQRLLLAAALAVRPQVLVLDEPTAGLDLHSRKMLLDLLKEQSQRGLCCVMISHEIQDLTELCNDVAWLHPADQIDSPSNVEMTRPDALIERLTSHQT